MTPMDMRTLLASLEAIEHKCTHEKVPAPSGEKASQKSKAGAKRPNTEPRCRFPRKSALRSLVSYARNMGARILCMLPRIAASTKKTER
jgi:hypothetical protein